MKQWKTANKKTEIQGKASNKEKTIKEKLRYQKNKANKTT